MDRERAYWPKVGAIAGTVIAIFVLRIVISDELGPFFVIPVLMMAFWFGPWQGVALGVVCTGLFLASRALNPDLEVDRLLYPTLLRLVLFTMGALIVGSLAEARRRLERQVVEQDRQLTELHAIQETLAPPRPEPRPGLELAVCYIPAQEGVAGDFYLVTGGPDESTVIAIGDVAGRGLEAAKRAWFVRTVLASSAEFVEAPGELLELANYSLIEESGISSEFVTAACLVVRPGDRSVAWSVAGHELPLVLDEAQPLRRASAPSVPLGLESAAGAVTSTAALDDGSGLLLYTDGLTEARRWNGDGSLQLFGIERVQEVLVQRPGDSAERVVTDLREAVEEFSGGPPNDDLCIVAVRMASESESTQVC